MNFHGFINLNKPSGPTSYDMIRALKRRLEYAKIGHGGTLDPLASGVLPLMLGRATRLAAFVLGSDKQYSFKIKFGTGTDTLDALGQITEQKDCSHFTSELVLPVLDSFRGKILQSPPAFSAVKINGQKSYVRARKGEQVQIAPREISVNELELTDWIPGPEPVGSFDITCSKGTYIRSLARDIGAGLSCPGHIVELIRTRVGPFKIEDSAPLDVLLESGGLQQWIIPPDAPLREMPGIWLDSIDAQRALNGAGVPAPKNHGPENGGGNEPVFFRLYGPEGRFIGLGRRLEHEPNLIHPEIVLDIPNPETGDVLTGK